MGMRAVNTESGLAVIPRLGGGVGAREVLRAGGIVGGRLVKVSSQAKPKVEQRAPIHPAKKVVPGVKVIQKPKEKPEWVPQKMTEKEERLADLLEAAQEVKPIADDVAEEQAGATEPYDDPEFALKPESVIPEPTVEVEVKPKKRRGRKRKNSKVQES
jgi:hypothetical protein